MNTFAVRDKSIGLLEAINEYLGEQSRAGNKKR